MDRASERTGVLVAVALGGALLALVVAGVRLMGDGDTPESHRGPPDDAGAGPGETDAEAGGGRDIAPGCDFSREPAQAAAPDPCSPPIDWDDFEWRGVEINMPARVPLPDYADPGLNPYNTRVPVYILFQTTALRARRYPYERAGIALTFVDRASGETFTSHLVETDQGLPMERPEVSDEELEDSVVRYYYNINALDFLQLPNRPATYDVHATFESDRSRVMTVTLE